MYELLIAFMLNSDVSIFLHLGLTQNLIAATEFSLHRGCVDTIILPKLLLQKKISTTHRQLIFGVTHWFVPSQVL